MKNILLVTAIMLFSISSLAEEGTDEVLGLMVAAKATGMCGTFKQMTAFQESTQMPGGDEFILRFLNTEAARLGKALPEFLEQCTKSVKIYTDMVSALEGTK